MYLISHQKSQVSLQTPYNGARQILPNNFILAYDTLICHTRQLLQELVVVNTLSFFFSLVRIYQVQWGRASGQTHAVQSDQ